MEGSLQPRILRWIGESAATLQSLAGLAPRIEEAARSLTEALARGAKVLFCGNGGSAADALHLAAELSGRFSSERRALPALALAGNPAALTAIGNDYGFEAVFARQVEAVGAPGDVLVAISTSGRSPNVIAALEAARARGLRTILLTGEGGRSLGDRCDLVLAVSSRDTPRVQEAHILIGHILCMEVETALFGGPSASGEAEPS